VEKVAFVPGDVYFQKISLGAMTVGFQFTVPVVYPPRYLVSLSTLACDAICATKKFFGNIGATCKVIAAAMLFQKQIAEAEAPMKLAILEKSYKKKRNAIMELQPEQQPETTLKSKLHMPKPTLFSLFKNLMKEVPLVSQLLDGGVQHRKDEAMEEHTKDEAMEEDTNGKAMEEDTKDEAMKEDTKDEGMEEDTKDVAMEEDACEEENACEVVEDSNLSPKETTKLCYESMKQKFYEMYKELYDKNRNGGCPLIMQ